VICFISNLAAQWLSLKNSAKHYRFVKAGTHVHNFLADSFYCAGLRAVTTPVIIGCDICRFFHPIYITASVSFTFRNKY